MTRRRRRIGPLSGVVLLGAVLLACQEGSLIGAGDDGRSAPVVLAVGDIASCGTDRDEATAALLEPAATILALGDLVHDKGSAQEFADCYQPGWGPYKAFTRPTPGDREYLEPSARAYFDAFGGAAGSPQEGWYSFEVGSWHVIALNSNCDFIGGCRAGSPQEQWMLRDLATHPTRCTLAYWHHPRFSSTSPQGGSVQLQALWDGLFRAGVDVMLAGHEHNYERFAALNDRGQPDPDRGIRQFVVGTGGFGLSAFGRQATGSEVRDNTTFGVLRLELGDGTYNWQFLAVDGRRVVDSGSDRCH